MPSALAEAFKAGLRAANRAVKSDEIVEYVRRNWRYFSPTRRNMEELCQELSSRGELTVTGLADALGLPSEVVFKKAKLVDAANLVLKMQTSPLYRLFMDTLEGRREKCQGARLCLVVVAGDRTLVMTDMPTRTVPGLTHLFVAFADGEAVNVFPIEDAPLRLPSVFNQESKQ